MRREWRERGFFCLFVSCFRLLSDEGVGRLLLWAVGEAYLWFCVVSSGIMCCG